MEAAERDAPEAAPEPLTPQLLLQLNGMPASVVASLDRHATPCWWSLCGSCS